MYWYRNDFLEWRVRIAPFESRAIYRLLLLAAHGFFFSVPAANSGVISELGRYRLLPGFQTYQAWLYLLSHTWTAS